MNVQLHAFLATDDIKLVRLVDGKIEKMENWTSQRLCVYKSGIIRVCVDASEAEQTDPIGRVAR